MSKSNRNIKLASASACTGCGACYSSCNSGAIILRPNAEGFLFPIVDRDKCIKCQKCQRACPALRSYDNISREGWPIRTYSVNNLDEQVRMNSTSGGVFLELARWVIQRGGVVYGARFNNTDVVHDRADTLDACRDFMGSKYVQSVIGDTYLMARRDLEKGLYVLYTGTPCQIAGLKMFLVRDYERLLTADIVCHGVPSPLVWHKYIKETFPQISYFNSISFRSKERGWQNEYLMKINGIDGSGNTFDKTVAESNCCYLTTFFRNFSLRKSCYNCTFKSLDSNADFTLGDSWGVQNYAPELFDNKGTSMLFVHTEKATNVLSEVRLMFKLVEIDTSVAMIYNPRSVRSVAPTHCRGLFFVLIRNFSLSNSEKITTFVDETLIAAKKVYHRICKKIRKLI